MMAKNRIRKTPASSANKLGLLAPAHNAVKLALDVVGAFGHKIGLHSPSPHDNPTLSGLAAHDKTDP
jgi:hypothetical protein